MTITLTLLALALVGSFAVLLVNILNAPEGHEDETGFHVTLTGGSQPKPVPARVKVSAHQFAI